MHAYRTKKVNSKEMADRLCNSLCYNENEAYQMYCTYAHEIGFSVRKEHHSYWPNSRKINLKDFACSKAGFRKDDMRNPLKKYRKSETRTGCRAMIRYAVDQDGVWSVKKLVEEHNHELARPEDHHLLRSFRSIGEEKATVLKSMTEAGIRTVDAFSYLAEEVGGVENVGFSKRDAYNYIQREKTAKIERGDTNSLIQLFKDRQLADQMFAWDAQVDEFDRLVSFFWVDGLGRIDYDCFGDVIIFDTSYRLNKYNLCCAPMVCVNNHWQNVLVGVAFLSEETIESFTWLFSTFLRIMGGKQPITIFTDQDQAMSRAIEEALPQTRHRLCQWHISKKIPSKVPLFNSNSHVRGLFYKCMSKCDSIEEFDQTWAEMVTEGDLHDNTWLQDLHRIRVKWSTAFNKDFFSMGILSTQRSESTNNVCHGISKPTSSLTDCFLGLEKVMNSWRRNEQDEDFKCSQSVVVPLIRDCPILLQASKFYSRKLYSLFEEAFLQGVGGMFVEHSTNDVTRFVVKKLQGIDQSSSWVVHYEAKEENIVCSCMKFQTMGLLCSHCIRVYNQLGVRNIPNKYLLFRWSARAKKDHYAFYENKNLDIHGETSMLNTDAENDMIFRNYTSRYLYQISLRAQKNPEAKQYMRDMLKNMSEDVDMILEGKNPKQHSKRKAYDGKSTLKDPAKCRPKGISNARLKGHWEKRRKSRRKVPLSQGSCIADGTASTAMQNSPQSVEPSQNSFLSAIPYTCIYDYNTPMVSLWHVNVGQGSNPVDWIRTGAQRVKNVAAESRSRLLEQEVAENKTYFCCVHIWTRLRDELLLRLHADAMRRHCDTTRTFLTLEGWKYIQENLSYQDFHCIGLHHIQMRYHQLKRWESGYDDDPNTDRIINNLILYRRWSRTPASDEFILNRFLQMMNETTTDGRERTVLTPTEWEVLQAKFQDWWNCCPPVNQLRGRVRFLLRSKGYPKHLWSGL